MASSNTSAKTSSLPDDFLEFRRTLPPPFDLDDFRLMQRGIFEQSGVDVFVNADGDFVCLYPRPDYRYDDYATASRAQRLGLKSYQITINQKHEKRFAKLKGLFENVGSFLEVGAASGDFLSYLQSKAPTLRYGSLEVDQSLKAKRAQLPWLDDFASFAELHASGRRFSLIGMFHVLEHILEPTAFLADCVAALEDGGHLVIEVPSLSDPLLAVYDCDAYRRFYFQLQHPYVYSANSLTRLLEHADLHVTALIPFQRYGLENHLQWLSRGTPGGNEQFRALFCNLEEDYRESFEAQGKTDTIIAVATPRAMSA